MGFSATGDKKIDDTFDLLTAIRTILNGDMLEDRIKSANALSALEAGKAAEAREKISHYESLVAEHQKKKNALDALHESLISDQKTNEYNASKIQELGESQKKENESSLALIKGENLKLDARKNDLDAQESEIKKARKELGEIESNIMYAQTGIEKDRLAAAALKKEAQDLRDKAQAKLDSIIAAASKE